VNCEKGRIARFADFRCVTDVVIVAVGEGHVGHSFRRLIPGHARFLERRVPLEEGIDEDNAVAGLNSEAGVAEPGNLHEDFPLSQATLPVGGSIGRASDATTLSITCEQSLWLRTLSARQRQNPPISLRGSPRVSACWVSTSEQKRSA